MSGHTPGPWNIHRTDLGHDCIDPIGLLLDTEFLQDNQYLLAACPEMYRALKGLESHALYMVELMALKVSGHKLDKWFAVLAAIKKAEGKS